jgi:hypothetical protein
MCSGAHPDVMADYRTAAANRALKCADRNDFYRRVIDGARTRDPKDHNLVLCQLSYDHHLGIRSDFIRRCTAIKFGAARGLTYRSAGIKPSSREVD